MLRRFSQESKTRHGGEFEAFWEPWGKGGGKRYLIVHQSVRGMPEYRGGRPTGSQPAESQPALGLNDELTDWMQTPKRLERLQRMQKLADGDGTDILNHDDYFEPTDEELQEKREDEKNAISGHRPPDYQGLASRLEKEVPFFRGR
ncbi:MAG: hypothetical protein WCJ35_23115, partial [Planctomycetota bacterium]